MSKKEARYRKVRVALWTDSRFRRLPKTEPSARHLYWFLRTGPHTTMIPGVFQARAPGLADDLGWEVDGFHRCFGELERQQLAFADWTEGLVFIPDVIGDESPRSGNQIEGWRLFWDELPECELKIRIHVSFDAYFKEGPKSFYSIFLKTFGRNAKENPNSLPKKPERKPEIIQEETRKKAELTVNRIQETGTSTQEPGTSVDTGVYTPERNAKENPNSLPKKPERKLKSVGTKSDKPVVRGKKLDSERLKEGQARGNKNKKSAEKRSRNDRPIDDLFALPEGECKKLVRLLEKPQKESDQTEIRKKKVILAQLYDLVIAAYKKVILKYKGSEYFKINDKGKDAAKKIGVGCIAYRLEPELLIEYWVEHNFTPMDFPTLYFISSEKNMATAAAELAGGFKRRKGYNPVNEGFEDDSEDDSAELQALAGGGDSKNRKGESDKRKNRAAREVGSDKRVARGGRKNVDRR